MSGDAAARWLRRITALCWGVGAVGKFLDPYGAPVVAGLRALHVDSWIDWRYGSAAIIATETALCVEGITRRSRAFLAWSGSVLVAFMCALAARGLRDGWTVECGCFGALWRTSVFGGLARNLVLLVAILAVVRLERKGRADAARSPVRERPGIRALAPELSPEREGDRRRPL